MRSYSYKSDNVSASFHRRTIELVLSKGSLRPGLLVIFDVGFVTMN